MPQTEEQKIRTRLRSYERKLRQEKRKFGDYSDGAGKRYEIGPHYLLLGDEAGALAAFEWFERELDDDVGRPDHALCWSRVQVAHRLGRIPKILSQANWLVVARAHPCRTETRAAASRMATTLARTAPVSPAAARICGAVGAFRPLLPNAS